MYAIKHSHRFIQHLNLVTMRFRKLIKYILYSCVCLFVCVLFFFLLFLDQYIKSEIMIHIESPVNSESKV